MNRVEISRYVMGLCFMQVCAEPDATDEEILEKCNSENPSGTSNGWSFVCREDWDIDIQRPCRCDQYENRLHFMVGC